MINSALTKIKRTYLSRKFNAENDQLELYFTDPRGIYLNKSPNSSAIFFKYQMSGE